MQLDIEHFNKLDRIITVVSDAGGGYVTIAGGAVRDSVLEKPIADIDVFYSGELDNEMIEAVFGKKTNTKESIPEKPKVDWDLPFGSIALNEQIKAHEEWVEKYEDYGDTFSVDNYKGDAFNFDGMKLQLINVVDVDAHISSFPCYLSRMMYSEGCLVIPKEAIQDASLKIVRFTDECDEKYKEKISAKYEDYL